MIVVFCIKSPPNWILPSGFSVRPLSADTPDIRASRIAFSVTSLSSEAVPSARIAVNMSSAVVPLASKLKSVNSVDPASRAPVPLVTVNPPLTVRSAPETSKPPVAFRFPVTSTFPLPERISTAVVPVVLPIVIVRPAVVAVPILTAPSTASLAKLTAPAAELISTSPAVLASMITPADVVELMLTPSVPITSNAPVDVVILDAPAASKLNVVPSTVRLPFKSEFPSTVISPVASSTIKLAPPTVRSALVTSRPAFASTFPSKFAASSTSSVPSTVVATPVEAKVTTPSAFKSPVVVISSPALDGDKISNTSSRLQ